MSAAPAAPDRAWSIALALAALATAAPLFAGRFLPFSDLPEHVAAIGTLLHWRDSGFRIEEHYVLAVGRSQYLLYHLAGAAIAPLAGGAETANRLLLALAAIGYPYGTRSLLRALGRDPRLAIFACPFFWSHALVWGLLPFVASVPVTLFGLATDARRDGGSRRRRFVILAGFALVLFHLHVVALLVFALVGGLMSVQRSAASGHSWHSWKERVADLAWLAPAAIVASVWIALADVGLGHRSLHDDGQIVFAHARSLPEGFAFWADNAWRSHADEALSVGRWVAIVGIALDGFLWSRRARRARGAPRAPAGGGAAPWIPLLVAAVLYLALPFRIGAADSINMRVGVFVSLFAIVALDSRRGRPLSLALGAGVALALGTSIGAAYEVRSSQREVAGLDRVLEAIPQGARALELDFVRRSERTHVNAWVHAVSYHRARAGGVAAPSFSSLGHWPIQFRPGAAPPEKERDFWEFAPCLFRNGIDGRYFDYILVRGPVDPFRDGPPGPTWEPTVREGAWTLFAKVAGGTNPSDGPDRGPCAGADPS